MNDIGRKISLGFNLLFNDPKKLLSYFRVQLDILRVKMLHGKDIKVVNEGERYDPELTTGYVDTCHFPRYFFARSLIRPDDSVIDIACGTGYWTEILSKECGKITGVDISKDAVDYASKKRTGENLKFQVGDIHATELQADVVVSFETIEHVPEKTIEDTVSKLLSMSKRLLIGSYPYKEVEWMNRHHHHFHLDENSIWMAGKGCSITFFYQSSSGKITQNKNEFLESDIQNLVFTITKQ